jgi:hypothetical protein
VADRRRARRWVRQCRGSGGREWWRGEGSAAARSAPTQGWGSWGRVRRRQGWGGGGAGSAWRGSRCFRREEGGKRKERRKLRGGFKSVYFQRPPLLPSKIILFLAACVNRRKQGIIFGVQSSAAENYPDRQKSSAVVLCIPHRSTHLIP